MVKFLVMEPTHDCSNPTFDISSCIFLDLFQAFGDVRSVGEDVLGNYEVACGSFVNLNVLLARYLEGAHRGMLCVCS